MWQPNREYFSKVEYTYTSVQGTHSSFSRAGPAIRLFHTVELCRHSLAVYPSSAMHIYGLMDVGPVGCVVCQKCRC